MATSAGMNLQVPQKQEQETFPRGGPPLLNPLHPPRPPPTATTPGATHHAVIKLEVVAHRPAHVDPVRDGGWADGGLLLREDFEDEGVAGPAHDVGLVGGHAHAAHKLHQKRGQEPRQAVA